MSNAYSRGAIVMLGEVDTMESEIKSERVRDNIAYRKLNGQPNAYLGYGWNVEGRGHDRKYTINDEQAEIVREITRRLLANESIRAITQDLNDRGVPAGSRAKTWTHHAVRTVALRASNTALRVHHRGLPDDELLEGSWPALVERADWRRLVAMMKAPERTSHIGVRPGGRKHLLTFGIGECGVCHGPLRVKGRSGGKVPPTYICLDGCVSRVQAPVDALVAQVVIEYMSDKTNLDWLLNKETTRTGCWPPRRRCSTSNAN